MKILENLQLSFVIPKFTDMAPLKPFQKVLYHIRIECEDGMYIHIFHPASGHGLEQELKDYFYQLWFEMQGDLSKYYVEEYGRTKDLGKVSLQVSLAQAACVYSENFECLGH
jgi:hypothetical protein